MFHNHSPRSPQALILHHVYVSCKHFNSCLIASFQLFFVVLCLFNILECQLFHFLLTGTSTFFIFIWRNHLSLFSHMLCTRGNTPTLFLITSFIILSSLVWPCIHLVICVSTTMHQLLDLSLLDWSTPMICTTTLVWISCDKLCLSILL